MLLGVSFGVEMLEAPLGLGMVDGVLLGLEVLEEAPLRFQMLEGFSLDFDMLELRYRCRGQWLDVFWRLEGAPLGLEMLGEDQTC